VPCCVARRIADIGATSSGPKPRCDTGAIRFRAWRGPLVSLQGDTWNDSLPSEILFIHRTKHLRYPSAPWVFGC